MKSFQEENGKRLLLRVWNLLHAVEKRKVALIAIVQMLLGFLDLIAIAIISVIATISVTGFGVSGSNVRANQVLEFLRIQDFTLQNQVALLGSLAFLALILRTGCTAYFTRKIIRYLSYKGAELSARAVTQTFEYPILELQKKSQQDTLFSITSAPMYLFVGIIGSLVTVVSDASLLFLIICGLMVVDFVSTLFTFLILGTCSYLVYRMLRIQARDLGQEVTLLNVASNSKILEVLDSYRFLKVRNRTKFMSEGIEKLRLENGLVMGKIQFMPHISKYYVEIALIVFAFGLATAQFLFEDANKAISTLAVFFLAGSRIAPAALRIQQGALSIRNNLGITYSSLAFLEDLEKNKKLVVNSLNYPFEVDPKGSLINGELSLTNISFRYPNSQSLALENISFSISSGSFNAIVGHSGSGKSTLADIMLGILEPQDGKVSISGVTPIEAIKRSPGSIAYVPQSISLTSGTIQENVIWGYEKSSFEDNAIWQALQIASLEEWVESLPDGIHTHIGDNGLRLSGGQRQRLGIARAMITNPKILILDEATSSLDATTEAEISAALRNLHGNVTLIVIAHRLSTIKLSDQVLYMSSGRLVDSGLFQEVRDRNPEFDSQALLMGL
jgi:ABC-type multidrug transport system fused ATPase/permease subunit